MEGFVKDFEEKNLLNKRNTAIELCNKGWTIEEIARTLKMSRDEVELALKSKNVEKPKINDSPVRENWIIKEISNFLNISNDEAILLLEQEYVEKKSDIIASLGKKIRKLKGL